MILLDVFLPLPLRWLSLIIFGQGCFLLAVKFLKWYADIEAGAIFFDNDESESSLHFTELLKSFLLYSIFVYSILRILLLFSPLILSPLLAVIGVVFALIQPINIGALSLRYKFLRYAFLIIVGPYKTVVF